MKNDKQKDFTLIWRSEMLLGSPCGFIHGVKPSTLWAMVLTSNILWANTREFMIREINRSLLWRQRKPNPLLVTLFGLRTRFISKSVIRTTVLRGGNKLFQSVFCFTSLTDDYFGVTYIERIWNTDVSMTVTIPVFRPNHSDSKI